MKSEQKQIEKVLTPDEPVWCQLAPYGSYDGRSGEKTVTQLLDKQAFERLISAFEPEVLVDYEHRAENTDDTEAAGWIQGLRITPDGLEALIRWTDKGADVINARRLRYLSPVWPLDDDGRPLALKSCALTNTPNFKLRPVLNKSAPGGETKNPNKGDDKMKEIAALFGLPETATEAEILEAAKAAKAVAAELESRLAELEAAALNTEAEAVAEENEEKIENKQKFIELYVANKKFALEMLANIKVPVAEPVANKREAKPPAAWGTVQNKLEQYRAMPPGKEKDAFLALNKDELLRLERQQEK